MLIPKPDQTDVPDYYQGYTALVQGNDLLQCLREGQTHIPEQFRALPVAMADYRYATGKWSVKEVLLHLIDTERIMCYRALRFSRHDTTPLPGFEQDDYVPYSGASKRSMESLLEEYVLTRQCSMAFLASLTSNQWQFKGTASGVEFNAAMLGFIVCGHELHHLKVLRERYLGTWERKASVL